MRHNHKQAAAFAFLCVCVAGGDSFAQESTSSTDLGKTVESSIEVCKPEGEREYLARLVCPDSSHPKFQRIGSVGMRENFPAGMTEEDQMKQMFAAMSFGKVDPGSPEYHFVDSYSVKCGATETTLHLDMYHCEVPPPTLAPDGFTIIN